MPAPNVEVAKTTFKSFFCANSSTNALYAGILPAWCNATPESNEAGFSFVPKNPPFSMCFFIISEAVSFSSFVSKLLPVFKYLSLKLLHCFFEKLKKIAGSLSSLFKTSIKSNSCGVNSGRLR